MIAFNPSPSILLKWELKNLEAAFMKNKSGDFKTSEEAAYLTGVDYENEKLIFKKLDG